MNKIVLGASAAAVGISLLVAGPAGAATPAPHGAGYVASVSSKIKGARVTVRVPKVRCAKGTSTQTIKLGLFATNTNDHAVTLFVRASCIEGRAGYAVRYEDHAGGVSVSAGDLVRLILDGTQGYEIDNLTTGEGVGSGSAGSGPQPTLTRSILVGAQISYGVPAGIRTSLSYARVNGTKLESVSHSKQAGARGVTVGKLSNDRFAIATS